MLTVAELDAFLRRLWADRDYPIPEGERMGVPIPELIQESFDRLKGLEPSVVATWVAILDELQSWFISLLLIVYQGRGTPMNDFERSITTVLSKIVGDTFAIRHLVAAGFDTSARTVLRSTSEYMEVLVALIDDPSFSASFVTSDSPEGAKAFWQNHLRGGKIQKRVRRAWRAFFRKEEDSDAASFFSIWGRDDIMMMSGLAHPSFAGGMFTALPSKTKHTDEAWLGIWGDRSERSADTIYTYCKFMFPILLLQRGFPFGGNWPLQPPLSYDSDEEMHRHVKMGRDVLASLVLSLGTENNQSHIFPEIDYSIFPI